MNNIARRLVIATVIALVTTGTVSFKRAEKKTKCKSGICQVMGYHSYGRCHK